MSLGSTIALLLAITSTTLAQNPSWVEAPVDTKVRQGENTTLRCRIANRGARQMSWDHFDISGRNNRLFIDETKWSTNDRVSVVAQPDGYDLRITNVQKSEEGDYQCVLQLSDLNKRVKLTVIGERTSHAQ